MNSTWDARRKPWRGVKKYCGYVWAKRSRLQAIIEYRTGDKSEAMGAGFHTGAVVAGTAATTKVHSLLL